MKELTFSLENIKEAGKNSDQEFIIHLPQQPTEQQIELLFQGLAYLTQLGIKFTVVRNHKDSHYTLVINR